MEQWVAAFAAMGGLTALGGLIDLAMWKAEKEKLKSWLEDWWLRFTDVAWSNFGRNESDLAVQILDRWAGPRLWSWKRWRFCLIVTVAAYALVSILLLAAALWRHLGIFGALRDEGQQHDLATHALIVTTMYIGPALVAFALSLSVTRYIAVVAARVSRGVLFNALSFTALLLVHVVLYMYWSGLVSVLQTIPLDIWIGLRFGFHDLDLRYLVAELPARLEWQWTALDDRWEAFVKDPTDRILIMAVCQTGLKVAMDILANGLRIVFALLFLSSFIFRPLIQTPISRLWYGAMNSGKPFFTMLFGAAGALVAAVQVLSR